MKELRDIKNRYEFALDTRQAVLIVSGLILMLMLSFLMGTLFGRNLTRMADKNGDKPVAVAKVTDENIEARETPVTVADRKDAAASEQPAPDSRSKLIAELESMKVPDQVAPPSTQPEVAEPPMMARLDLDGESEPAEDEPSPAPAPKAEKPQAEKTPSVSHTVVPAGAYTIQLSSLPHKADADLLVGDLKEKRYDAYMLQVSLPDKGTFYRVRIGHYKDLEQAQKALKILQTREGKYYDAWITQ